MGLARNIIAYKSGLGTGEKRVTDHLVDMRSNLTPARFWMSILIGR